MRMEMRKVIGVLVVLATSGAEAVLARAVSSETIPSGPSTDEPPTCSQEGASTCPAPVVYNPEDVKAFAETKVRELQETGSDACQAILKKNEGDIQRFDGENEQYVWHAKLIKVKANCELKWFELEGKKMGLEVAGADDADDFSCGNQGCRFKRKTIQLYNNFTQWVEADTESTGSHGRKYRSLIPRPSVLLVVTQLPRPAFGCCGGATKCKVIPPKLEITRTNYSRFSQELQNAIAAAIAGGSDLHSIPTPVCYEEYMSEIPKADEDSPPPFCHESYEDVSFFDSVVKFSYKATIPVQVGERKAGSTIEFCYSDQQASPFVFVGAWLEIFGQKN